MSSAASQAAGAGKHVKPSPADERSPSPIAIHRTEPLLNLVAEDGPVMEPVAVASMLRVVNAVLERVASQGAARGLSVLVYSFQDNVLQEDDGSIRLGNGAAFVLRVVSVVGSCELTSSPVAECTEMPRTESRSPFIAPEIAVPAPSEAAAGPSELAAEFAEPAVVWSLGIFCYTLLAGYPPFESSNAMCPFFKDYSTMNRLACPPHFSAPAIALLCSTLTRAPEARIKLEARRHPAAAVPSPSP